MATGMVVPPPPMISMVSCAWDHWATKNKAKASRGRSDRVIGEAGAGAGWRRSRSGNGSGGLQARRARSAVRRAPGPKPGDGNGSHVIIANEAEQAGGAG